MRDFFMAPRIAEHLSLKSKDQMVRWLDLIPEGDDFEQQLAQLKFLYRAAQAFQEAGEGARLEEAAEKAYQRARLMFDDMGRSLDLIDMCAQLCHWLPSRRADAYNWELVAAAEALRKRKEDLEKRLSTVYKNPVGHLARALASLGLYTLARKKRESAKARKNKELFKAELGEISRIEREELENLARQKSDVVLATVGTKLSYLALYEEEIRRVLEER